LRKNQCGVFVVQKRRLYEVKYGGYGLQIFFTRTINLQKYKKIMIFLPIQKIYWLNLFLRCYRHSCRFEAVRNFAVCAVIANGAALSQAMTA
jgi:hypothetical protein